MVQPKKRKHSRPWQQIAQEAQDHRDASLAQVGLTASAGFEQSGSLPKSSLNVPEKVLEHHDLRITETLPEDLLKRLAIGELSTTEVTTAFLRRAVLAQKLVSHQSSIVLPLIENVEYVITYIDKLHH